jgi:adenine-specific DNA-methyltransferase
MQPDHSSALQDAKNAGAFYTDVQIAEFLVWWAVRSPLDTVLDPSFGGGVFLRAACQRLENLGGSVHGQVFGAELDSRVHQEISLKLHEEFRIPASSLLEADFFSVDRITPAGVDVVVGNPPFIRYQRFTGAARERALACAASAGVTVSGLASSWLPFLVHSVAQLKLGGRLAMVLPFELTQAAYARAGLDFLARSFGTVSLLTFRKKLFTDLSEDTLLLLAQDKGRPSRSWRWRDLAHSGELAEMIRRDDREVSPCRVLDAERLATGEGRLIDHLLTRKARELYRKLGASIRSVRLGELADVGIGYVTGANEFFHLSPNAARYWKIPSQFLRPAVRRGRSLRGLFFTNQDWELGTHTGEAGYLLHIQPKDDLPASVQRYLATAQDIRTAYKVRSRKPWYAVPHVYHPDGFLSYMSGTTPRLVANDAGVVAPNSLHILRLRPTMTLNHHAIPALWQTSLTRLSVELEGHALGGGMLKLEPKEAGNVLVAWPANFRGLLDDAKALDTVSRTMDENTAMNEADNLILRQRLHLTRADCTLLQQAANMLQQRRLARA